MNRSQLRKVQACQLDLALEVKRICEKHSINYFLVDGTALGAVKYGGFIPWDDDLDIGMMIDDYNKFINICQNELDNQYYIHNFYNNPKYGNCFSQLKIKGTIYHQKMWESQNEGIFIDIHPFVPITNNKLIMKFTACLFKFHKISLLLKSGGNVENKLSVIISFINKFRSRDGIIRSINKIFNKYSSANSTIALKISGRHYDKDYIYIENINKLKNINFEGASFPIMPDYDRMLKMVYGDYLFETPSSNVENRHGITYVDFGNYQPKSII